MKKVDYRSKNEIVYDHMRSAIISGEYKPSTRLVIDQLAIDLGVSQIPIREAMRVLESEGFVTIEPHAGATVTPLDADLIFEVFGLLASTEILTSRTACCRMSDADLNTLEAHILKMDRLVNDPAEWSRRNKELHLYICDCAHSVLARQMTQKVLAHWDRLRQHYLQDVFARRIHDAQREHHEILAAFRRRDPDGLEKAIRHHNLNALNSYLEHLRSTGLITPEMEGCP